MRKLMETIQQINEENVDKSARTYNPVQYKKGVMKGDGTCIGCGGGLPKGTEYLGKVGGYPHGPFRLCDECENKIVKVSHTVS